jgi:integrase
MWLEWRQTNGKPISPTTLNNYRGTIETKIRPALGTLPINRVDARTLDRFYGQLRTRGNARQDRWKDGKAKTSGGQLSASRVRDVHAIISGALGLAARWGWLPHNPAILASPPAPRNAKRPTPTMDELGELFAAVADDPEFELYVRLAATTGLRPGELCALWWDDFDLDAVGLWVGFNLVHGKREDIPGDWVRKEPKSDHGRRMLALDPRTVRLVKAHRARRGAELRAEGVDLPAQSFVFAGSIDGATPIRRDRMTRRFGKLTKRLGHGYTLYGLRHFMATQLGAVATAGTVRDRMGHGNLAVTSGYMHPVTEADRAAAKYMGKLLDGQRPRKDKRR